MALDVARTRTGFQRLTALLGNEIRICLYYPSMDIRRWHRVGETFKVFGPDEMELAIVYVNGFGRR
jgi:hypothetical protein